jgi:hypothetical protein
VKEPRFNAKNYEYGASKPFLMAMRASPLKITTFTYHKVGGISKKKYICWVRLSIPYDLYFRRWELLKHRKRTDKCFS